MNEYSLTPSQTVGPFFHDGLLREDARRNVLAAAGCAGERVRLEGHVYDGDRVAVPDALIEIWQADSQGRYRQASDPDGAFLGFGRTGTDATGAYSFETIKPGPVPLDR